MASRQLYAMLLILCLLQSRRAINKQRLPHTFYPCQLTPIRSFNTRLRSVPHPTCMTLPTRCHIRDCWQRRQQCVLIHTIKLIVTAPPSPTPSASCLECRVLIFPVSTRYRPPRSAFDRLRLARPSSKFNGHSRRKSLQSHFASI